MSSAAFLQGDMPLDDPFLLEGVDARRPVSGKPLHYRQLQHKPETMNLHPDFRRITWGGAVSGV